MESYDKVTLSKPLDSLYYLYSATIQTTTRILNFHIVLTKFYRPRPGFREHQDGILVGWILLGSLRGSTTDKSEAGSITAKVTVPVRETRLRHKVFQPNGPV